MASWQAHAIDMFARMHLKPRLAGERDLARARAILSEGSFPVPAGAVYRAATLDGVLGEWVAPAQCPTPVPVVLYLHGGGYFTGTPKAHRPITASLAKAGFNVFVPEYRLAPEHPYPAAVDDAESAWNSLIALGHPPGAIGVAGDSAGGGVALALMIRLRNKGRTLPAAAALFSPWTDLAVTGDSLHRWLLQTRDRHDSDAVPLTQEFLAQMLGVQRTTVTMLAKELQTLGLINYRRGRIEIVNRAHLEERACECYETARRRIDSVFSQTTH